MKERLTSQSPLHPAWCCLWWPAILLGSPLRSGNSNLGLATIFGISWFHIKIPRQKLFLPSDLSRAENGFSKDLVSHIPSYSTNTFNLHLCLQKTGLTHLWNLYRSLQVHPSSTALLTPRSFYAWLPSFSKSSASPWSHKCGLHDDKLISDNSLGCLPGARAWALKLSNTKLSSWVTTTLWWLWLYICMSLHRFYLGLGFTAVINKNMWIRALCLHTRLIVSVPSSI